MEQVDLASEAGTDCEDKMSHASSHEAESEMAEAIAAIVDRVRQNDFPSSLHFRNISDNVFASDALEWETWLCCRAASRQVRADAFSQSQTQNAKIL